MANKREKVDVSMLIETVKSIERKLEENREEFENAPLTIEVKKADGAWVERKNPTIEMYRDLVNSYVSALRQLEAMGEVSKSQSSAKVSAFKSRVKAVGA